MGRHWFVSGILAGLGCVGAGGIARVDAAWVTEVRGRPLLQAASTTRPVMERGYFIGE